MKKNKLFYSAVLSVTLLTASITGCSKSNLSDNETKSISETKESEDAENTKDFDTNAYLDSATNFNELLSSTAILISNMGNYEHNYWSSMNKVNGTIDYEKMVSNAYSWLEKKGNTSQETVESNYEQICSLYKELVTPDTDASDITNIAKKTDELFSAFNSFYLLVTAPSGDINTFADNFNTYSNQITSLTSELEILLK